jgi:acyl carrier protein
LDELRRRFGFDDKLEVKKRAQQFDDYSARCGGVAHSRIAWLRAAIPKSAVLKQDFFDEREVCIDDRARQGQLGPRPESRHTMETTPSPAKSYQSDLIAVISEAIRSISAKAREVAISPATLLLEELALDSLDLVAVILQIQDHYQVEIDPDEIPNLRCVDDLVKSVTNHLRAAA